MPHADSLLGVLEKSSRRPGVVSGMSDDGRLEDKGTDENAGAAWVLRPSSNGTNKPLAEPQDSRGYSVTPSSGPQLSHHTGGSLVLGRSVRKTLSRVRKKVTGFSASEARASAALAAAEAAEAEAALAEKEALHHNGEMHSNSALVEPTLAVTAEASSTQDSPVKPAVDNPTNAVNFALGFLWATREICTDLALADIFFSKAAKRGHAASLCARGFLCEHRRSANPTNCDLREAGEWYAAAAANGCAIAGARLAELILSGAVDPPGYSAFLVDRWRRRSQAGSQPLPQKLAALAALEDEGRVSNAEFAEAKKQLLRGITGADNHGVTLSIKDSNSNERNECSGHETVAEEEEAEEDAWAAKRVKRAVALLRAASAGGGNQDDIDSQSQNQGDPVAMHRLAWLLLDGVAVDDEDEVEEEEEVKIGPSETKAPTSSANTKSNEAFQLLRQAAGLGHARAQYDLGVLIREGRASAAAAGQLAGPSRRRTGGAGAATLESESVDLLTGTSSGSIHSTGGDAKAAERAARAAARAARVAAMKQRASSDAAAVALWRKAASQGLPEAHYALFSLYAGQGEAWEGFAFKPLTASTNASAVAAAAATPANKLTPRRRDRSPRASGNVNGVTGNPGSPAVRASASASERGDAAPALSSPGRLAPNGGSVHHHARTPPPPPLTKQEALAHLEAAAQGGWPPACCDLAHLLLGDFHPSKRRKADSVAPADAPTTPKGLEWQAGLADIGLMPDKARAVQLLARAAHAGSAPAQLRLGQLLEKGAHVVDSPSECTVLSTGVDSEEYSSRSLIESAEEEVEQKHEVEKVEDGATWQVHAEPTKAAEWYRRAAAQGCPHSALALAHLLAKLSRCGYSKFVKGEQQQQFQETVVEKGGTDEALQYETAFPHLPVHLRGPAAATAEACDVLAQNAVARALPGGSEILASLLLERGRVEQARAVLAELVDAGTSADPTEGDLGNGGATVVTFAAALVDSSEDLQRRAEAAAVALKALEARRVTLPPKPELPPPPQVLSKGPSAEIARALPPRAPDWPLDADPLEGALAGLSGDALLEATAMLGTAEIIQVPPLPPASSSDDDYVLGLKTDQSAAAALAAEESTVGLKKAPPMLCRYCTQHNFHPSEVFRNKPAGRCKSCGSDTSKEAEEDNGEVKPASREVSVASPSPVKGSRSPLLLCDYCTLHGFEVTAAFLKKSPSHCKSCGEDTAKEKKNKGVEQSKSKTGVHSDTAASDTAAASGKGDALSEEAAAERRKPADDFLCVVRNAILACEAGTSEFLSSPRRRAAVAAERAAAISLDAKLEGSNDDNLAKEQRRLAVEWSVKLQRELARKAKVLDALYDRATLAKLEKKRKQERSLRTVEGYDDAWFTTSGFSGGGALPSSRSSNDLLRSVGGDGGSVVRRSSQSSEPDHRRRGSNNHHMLSAVARASRVMDNLIRGYGNGIDWNNTYDRSRVEGHRSSAVQWASLLEFGDLQFAPGLQVWRAEQFGVVYDPTAAYGGVLLRGNAYVVAELKLETRRSNGASKNFVDDGVGSTSILDDEEEDHEDASGGLEVTLYYWVGSKAPLDAATVASFKSTELARRLRADMASTDSGALAAGCRKVITRREAEGDESDNFLRAFQKHRARVAWLQAADTFYHNDGDFDGDIAASAVAAAFSVDIHDSGNGSVEVPRGTQHGDLAAPSRMGLQYSEGGTASSLLAPPPKNDRPRLFRVCLFARDTHLPSSAVHGTPAIASMSSKKRRGGIEASLCEVERSEASLRPEWVTILDSGGDAIYVYRGFLSTTLHRAKAFEMSLLMRQERVAFLGSCNLVQVNQGDEPDEFWALIPPTMDVDGNGDGSAEASTKHNQTGLHHPHTSNLHRISATDTNVVETAEIGATLRETIGATESRSTKLTDTVADTTNATRNNDDDIVIDEVAPPPPPSPSQLSPNGSKRGMIGQQQAAAWERNIEMALDEATNRVVSSLLQAASAKIVTTFYSTASGNHNRVNLTKTGKSNSGVMNESSEDAIAATSAFDVEIVFTESDGAMGLAMRDVVFFLPASKEATQDHPIDESEMVGNGVLDADSTVAVSAASTMPSIIEEACVQIVSVDPGSAGDIAGVQPGDLIKALNGRACDHLNRKAMAAQIRKAGRPLAMTLRRGFPLSQEDDGGSDLQGAAVPSHTSGTNEGGDVAANVDSAEGNEMDRRDLVANDEEEQFSDSKAQSKLSGRGLGKRLLNVQRLFGKRHVTKAGEELINENAASISTLGDAAHDSLPTAISMNGKDKTHQAESYGSAHGDMDENSLLIAGIGGEKIAPPEKNILESSDDDGSSGEDDDGYDDYNTSRNENGTACATTHAATSSEFEVGSEAPAKLLKVFLPVERPVRLRPGEKVLVQRSTGTWVRGQVIEYMDERDEVAQSSLLATKTTSAAPSAANTATVGAADSNSMAEEAAVAGGADAAVARGALSSHSRQRPPGFVGAAISVRVGVLKKKVLDLGKPRHLAQLRVKPGTVLLEVSSPPREVLPLPASNPEGNTRAASTATLAKRDMRELTKRDLPLTPLPQTPAVQHVGNKSDADTSRRASDSVILRSGNKNRGGSHEQRRLTSGTTTTTNSSSEDAVLALDSGVDQRRILYRVGLIGNQYNIAEVYSRHEDDSAATVGNRPRAYSAASSASAASSNDGPAARVVSRTALKTNGVFVLDCSSEVYVWLGRAAPVGVRLAGISVAERLVSVDPLRPRWVTATQVQEGAEPFVFKTKFVDWLEANADAAAHAALRRRAAALRLTGETFAVTSQQAARQRAATKAAKANRSEASRAQETASRREAVEATARAMRAAYAYASGTETAASPPLLTVAATATMQMPSSGEEILNRAATPQDLNFTRPFDHRHQAPGAAEAACATAAGTDMPPHLALELAADRGGGMTLMWRLTPSQLVPVAEHEYGHLDDRAVFVVLYGFVPSVTAGVVAGASATAAAVDSSGISGSAGVEDSSDSGSDSDASSEASGAGEFDEYLQDNHSLENNDDDEIDPMVALLAAVKRRGLKLSASQSDARARRRRRRQQRRAKRATAGAGSGTFSDDDNGPSSPSGAAAAVAAAGAVVGASEASGASASSPGGGARFVLYVWCGDRAPRTLMARWRMEVSVPWRAGWKDELGCEPHELRVAPRREPPHFLRVFSRLLVMHVHFPSTAAVVAGAGAAASELGAGAGGGARMVVSDGDAVVQATLPQMAQKSALGAAIVAAAGSTSATSATSMPSKPDSGNERGIEEEAKNKTTEEELAELHVERHLFHVRGRCAGAWHGLRKGEGEENEDEEEEKYVHAVEVPLPTSLAGDGTFQSGTRSGASNSSRTIGSNNEDGVPQLLLCSTDVYLLLVQRPQTTEKGQHSPPSLPKPPEAESISQERVSSRAETNADAASGEANMSSHDELTVEVHETAAPGGAEDEGSAAAATDDAGVSAVRASELWVWVGLQSPGPLRSVGSDLAARLAERHAIDLNLIHVVLETPQAAAAAALAAAAATAAANSTAEIPSSSSLMGLPKDSTGGTSGFATKKSPVFAASASALKPSSEEEAFWRAAKVDAPWAFSQAGSLNATSPVLRADGPERSGSDSADTLGSTGATITVAQPSRSSWLGWAKAMKKSRSKRAKKKASFRDSTDVLTAPVPSAMTISATTTAADSKTPPEAAPASTLVSTNGSALVVLPEAARTAVQSVGWALCPARAPLVFRLVGVSEASATSLEDSASQVEQRDAPADGGDGSSASEKATGASTANAAATGAAASSGCFRVELLGQIWTQHDLTPEAIIVFDCCPGVSGSTERSSELVAAYERGQEPGPVLVWMGAKVVEQRRLRHNALACARAYANTGYLDANHLGTAAPFSESSLTTSTTAAAAAATSCNVERAESIPATSNAAASSSNSPQDDDSTTTTGNAPAKQRAVWLVRQYNEPLLFQALFHGWCPWWRFEREAFRDPRDARLKLLQAQQTPSKTASAGAAADGAAAGAAGADSTWGSHLGRVLDSTLSSPLSSSSLPPLPEARSTSKKQAWSKRGPHDHKEWTFTSFSSSSSESSDEDAGEEEAPNKVRKKGEKAGEDDEDESSMAAALLIEAAGLSVDENHAVESVNSTSAGLTNNQKGKKASNPNSNGGSGYSSAPASFFHSFVNRSKPIKATSTPPSATVPPDVLPNEPTASTPPRTKPAASPSAPATSPAGLQARAVGPVVRISGTARHSLHSVNSRASPNRHRASVSAAPQSMSPPQVAPRSGVADLPRNAAESAAAAGTEADVGGTPARTTNAATSEAKSTTAAAPRSPAVPVQQQQQPADGLLLPPSRPPQLAPNMPSATATAGAEALTSSASPAPAAPLLSNAPPSTRPAPSVRVTNAAAGPGKAAAKKNMAGGPKKKPDRSV